jgi:acyl carrier protein
MTVSSRTPEGVPHRCEVCGKVSAVEPSYPGGDSCCPNCGQLLWWFRDRLSRDTGVARERITLSTSFNDIGEDSLDVVESIMELEEEFDVTIPSDAADRIKTVADAIRFIEEQSRETQR